MISNEKSLNYKVVDLDETYNFHVKFISIQVHTPTAVSQMVSRGRNPTTVSHRGCGIVLQNITIKIYFC
jgi:hypothetical protein